MDDTEEVKEIANEEKIKEPEGLESRRSKTRKKKKQMHME